MPHQQRLNNLATPAAGQKQDVVCCGPRALHVHQSCMARFVSAIPYQVCYRLSPRVSSSLQSEGSIRASPSRGCRRCKPAGRLDGTNIDLLDHCVLVRYYRPPILLALTITSGRALPAGRQLCCDLTLSRDVLHIQRVSTAPVSLCYRLL